MNKNIHYQKWEVDKQKLAELKSLSQARLASAQKVLGDTDKLLKGSYQALMYSNELLKSYTDKRT